MNTSESVRRFIIDELNWDGDASDLTEDYPLLEGGVLDSVGIFHLVGFLETEFGVELDDEELLPQNFESIGAVKQLVESKRA